MIGYLPTVIELGGTDWDIRSDYRIILLIFEALNDPDMTEQEKIFVMLDALYKDFENIPLELQEEAANKANIFINGGDNGCTDETKDNPVKTLDWKQDEQMIFSAVNKVAGKEIRLEEYMHWWTFLGYFSEIGECVLTNIMNIRVKKAKGKKLSKGEQAYYRENKHLIDIKKVYSREQLEEMDRINRLLD